VNICPEGEIGVEHLPPPLLARVAEPVAAEAMVAAGTVPVPAPVAGGDWLAIERQLIVDTLTRTRGNRSQAATILGWGRTTLWRKLKRHGLTPEAGARGGRS
jgi:transcriptional regulator of acetoin/glycerol metabolism